MNCPYCGFANADDAVECQACGKPLNTAPVNELDQPEPVADASPSGSPDPAEPTAPEPERFKPEYAAPAAVQQPAPIKKKGFPWGWVALGCGVVALGVLVVIFGALVILRVLPIFRSTGVPTNIVPNLNPPPAIATQLPEISPTQAPGTNPESPSQPGSLPFKFTGVNDPNVLGAPSLLNQMTTSLNLNNDTDFQAPKKYTGTAGLDPSNGFTVGNGWCAKDSATLKDNLPKIQYLLTINGKTIDLSKYPTLTFTDDRGDACAATGILITPTGALNGSYRVQLTQRFLSQLDDGITPSPYPAGDVTFDFDIRFGPATEPGIST